MTQTSVKAATDLVERWFPVVSSFTDVFSVGPLLHDQEVTLVFISLSAATLTPPLCVRLLLVVTIFFFNGHEKKKFSRKLQATESEQKGKWTGFKSQRTCRRRVDVSGSVWSSCRRCQPADCVHLA